MAVTDDRTDRDCGNELCCCPPVARVWVETRTAATFVENKIDMKRRLQVRADANASVRPPVGPDVNADGSGGSQLDEGTLKDQGKVYRTDAYTVHWQVEGDGPLQISLRLSGAVAYDAGWLPVAGNLTVSRNYLLEPPAYDPGGDAFLTAYVEAVNCRGQKACHTHTAPRP